MHAAAARARRGSAYSIYMVYISCTAGTVTVQSNSSTVQYLARYLMHGNSQPFDDGLEETEASTEHHSDRGT